jgi:predicted acylesterase/phospholipase RssA
MGPNSKRTRILLTVLSAAFSLTCAGCFAKVQQLPAQQAPTEPLFAPLPDQEFMVGLAVSGGGSRAATFAAAALEALAETPLRQGQQTRSVLETVSYMSSVSGGSVATAYYAAKKPPKSEPMLGSQGLSPRYREFFSAYKTAMQSNFQRSAVLRQLTLFRAFNPTKLAHSLSEVWDREFLGDMTFAHLYEKERRGDSPRVIFNGTVYNSGRRFAFTTLPASDFDYDFIDLLTTELKKPDRPVPLTPEGMAIIQQGLEKAGRQFLPLTFERIGADYRDLHLSLAVASSASFPPVVGPVTYQVAGTPPYYHIGDGGLFDNLGTESLTTLFLKKIPQHSTKRGLIIVIDTSFPFDAGGPELDRSDKGFEVFRDDPSRIVGIMEERANTYQTLLWHSLRTEGVILPDFAHLRIVVLKHVDAEWSGYQDLPDACRDEFSPDVTPTQIKQAVSLIPTLFKIKTACHGALLEKAARKVVERQRHRIVDFIEATQDQRRP